MSDRNQIRALAEEIASSQYNRNSMQAKAWRTVAGRWERRITAFLDEREADLQARLHRAESALRHHGYRESCDIPACNCGDQWMHGGHADARLREIRDELGELANGKTILRAVKDLQAQLHRALGELAGLRGLVEAYEALDHTLTPRLRVHKADARAITAARNAVAGHRTALASSPLSERAGALFAAALSEDLNWEAMAEAVDAFRAELGKGGDGG